MEPAVDPFARQYVRAKVQQLLPRARSAGVEAEELEADLLLNLVRRRPRFDPSRGRWTTYVRLVTDHQAADLLERWARTRPNVQATLSLSGLHSAAEGPANDVLPDEANVRRHGRHRRRAQELWELTIDVRESVEQLPAEDQQLCEALQAHRSAADTADSLGLSRRQVARRLRRIRRQFERRELQQYL